MAVTITHVTSSPNMLKYALTSDGGGSNNLDAATLLADALVTGAPLYALLGTAVGTQTAARNLVFGTSNLKINVLARDPDAAWIIDANTSGGFLRLTLTCAAADTSTGSYLTIEYIHSVLRQTL